MNLFRSLLFVPGNHPRRIEKAFELPADAVILDLEDACPVTEKVATRSAVVEALRKPRRSLGYVRVNALSTAFAYGDFSTVVNRGVDGIMLAKAESPGQIGITDWLITQLERERGMSQGSIDLIPLIETAEGLAQSTAIARAAKRVKRLAFGAGDFTADLGIRWSRDEIELLSFRSALIVASRTADIEPPIDLAWLNTKDTEGFGNSVMWARRLGFQGKLCIHPNQIQAINDAFSPTEEEVAHAKRVIETFNDAEARGSAAFALDGALVDYAIVAQARRILAAAAGAPYSGE
jgi:citrate lyase subunit beta/citryl-CoA lyase